MSATDDNSVFVVCDGPQIEATGPEHNPIEDWVTIIPDGYVTSERGNVVLDAEAAAEVIRKYEARGNDILIDYEHQSLGDEHGSSTGLAPAAGWITKLRYVAGKGLQGYVRWVGTASHMILNREYRYLSPVMVLNKNTRRLLDLSSVALTNRPAIHGFPELIAATANFRKRLIMADQPQPDESGQGLDTLVVTIRDLLGLPESSTVEGVLQAVIELLQNMKEADSGTAAEVRESLSLPDDAPDTEVVAAIAELKQSRVSPREFQAMRERTLKMEAETLVASWVQEDKLTNQEADIELRYLTSDPDQFEKHKQQFELRMHAKLPNCPPIGQTVPPQKDAAPNGRAAIIAKAGHEFSGEPDLAKFTNRAAFINLRLHEAGCELLTNDERVNHG